MNDALTLLELNRIVRELIEVEMPGEYWVKAELSECRESRGHCYMELIERQEQAATPVARASAKCWASRWAVVSSHFQRITGQQLHTGMKVMLKVYPQFHEAFGFSWIVTDIDPDYTLGDQARRRQEIISQLKQEGVFDLQRELQLPLFCLNIAVISSQSAAGYGDFAAQLADSPFAFRTQLFPAIMQGEQVEQSVVAALEKIYNLQFTLHSNPDVPSPTRSLSLPEDSSLFTLHSSLNFDCVVIIRGGGATSDLSGFDTLLLAENVAQFPLPIITGIGHDRDESILDMVSHQRVKTPTAAAALLIDHAQNVYDAICQAEQTIISHTQSRLQLEHQRLMRVAEAVPRLFSVVRSRQEARIDQFYVRLASAAKALHTSAATRLENIVTRLHPTAMQQLTMQRHCLQLLEQRVQSLDPQLLLQRGYSITLHNGHALHSPDDVKPGDVIETRLEKGTITSKIENV